MTINVTRFTATPYSLQQAKSTPINKAKNPPQAPIVSAGSPASKQVSFMGDAGNKLIQAVNEFASKQLTLDDQDINAITLCQLALEKVKESYLATLERTKPQGRPSFPGDNPSTNFPPGSNWVLETDRQLKEAAGQQSATSSSYQDKVRQEFEEEMAALNEGWARNSSAKPHQKVTFPQKSAEEQAKLDKETEERASNS